MKNLCGNCGWWSALNEESIYGYCECEKALHCDYLTSSCFYCEHWTEAQCNRKWGGKGLVNKNILTTWDDIYWEWVRKGCDRCYAAYMADRWEARQKKKEAKCATA
jgi:hypothetical protein